MNVNLLKIGKVWKNPWILTFASPTGWWSTQNVPVNRREKNCHTFDVFWNEKKKKLDAFKARKYTIETGNDVPFHLL